MKILVLDNYDSFTFNLVHYVEMVAEVKVHVRRNDEISLEEVAGFDKILLSPGPGIPAQAGILMDLIRHYSATKDILGICLGHQAIAEVFGARLTNLDKVFHGISTPIKLTGNDDIFNGIEFPMQVGRYHSWIASDENFPNSLEVTARDEQGNIMALRHKEYMVRGVQFHPESVLTPNGIEIIRNWISM
jgi:anthranilate synthase component 2